MVNPSTALAGRVAEAAGLVVVSGAVAVLPRARSAAGLAVLTSSPALPNASTSRALPASDTWLAVDSATAALNDTVVELPSRIETAPVDEFHDTWARWLTVNARVPLM